MHLHLSARHEEYGTRCNRVAGVNVYHNGGVKHHELDKERVQV